MSDVFIPRRPVVAAYPKMPGTFPEAEAMCNYLQEKGVEAAHGSLYDETLRKRVRRGEFDLLIMAGGDGSGRSRSSKARAPQTATAITRIRGKLNDMAISYPL